MSNNNRSSRPCPACQQSNGRYIGEKNGYGILACRACSTLYTSKLPSKGESENYNDYYSETNLSVPSFIHVRAREIIGEFESYRNENRFLDIGFGSGNMLLEAAKQGWDVFGQEVSRPAVENARTNGMNNVFLGELAQAQYPDHYFDVITASEIIEHLPEPETTLTETRRILRPGGVLWATTPFAKSLSFRLLGIDWSVLSPPEHLQLYSIEGMRRMLTRAGFSNIRFKTTGINPMEVANHVSSRFRTSLNKDAAFDPVQTGYRLNEQLTSSRSGLWIKTLANGTLNFLRIGDSLKILASH